MKKLAKQEANPFNTDNIHEIIVTTKQSNEMGNGKEAGWEMGDKQMK